MIKVVAVLRATWCRNLYILLATNSTSNMVLTDIHSELVKLVHPLVDKMNLQLHDRGISVHIGGLIEGPSSRSTLNLLQHNAAGG